jgi:hypothetical protein
MPLNKLEIPVGDEQDPDNTMTEAQDEQVNTMHSAAYRAVADVLGKEPEWDMEWIGELSDCISDICIRFHGKTEMEVYPYTEM